MSESEPWLTGLGGPSRSAVIDGLIQVDGYQPDGRPPEEVLMIDKARVYGASAVFFEVGRDGRPSIAQAFIFVSDGPANDPKFAEKHQRLWSWGGVPLLYRKTPGLVQLFRCAHKADFVSASGTLVCKPFRTLRTATDISNNPWWSAIQANSDPWWDATQLRTGTLWDDPKVCRRILSPNAAHKGLIEAVKQLYTKLNDDGVLKEHLRRRLLILSLLIAYLEEREAFPQNYFDQFLPGAQKFFEVLADGEALVNLLDALRERFNGGVFDLNDADRELLKRSNKLPKFARLIQARQEANGQLNLWQLYSFKDLPVELISHIYQLFVKNAHTSVYTPPFLVRLMLDETLSWERLDRLQKKDEIILDPCCGSGVFLVEAYKKLILHWRSRNGWKKPTTDILQSLLTKVHGIDLDEGAVELAAFSLCLALCDALEPATIRASIKLFPTLIGSSLHHSCFFEAKENGVVKKPVGVIVGNPPFESKLGTPGAERSHAAYEAQYESLPDKQMAYLFLHDAMKLLTPGGVVSMLQQYNFLYNHKSAKFRHAFIKQWNVREVLDFISVRGLFKDRADTKVLVVIAEATQTTSDQQILHATFRRSGRADAEVGFDIDFYDLHWVPVKLALSNDGVWRADLLGGSRVLRFVDRLKTFRTLGQFTDRPGWDVGEGFIQGIKNADNEGTHITGKRLIEPKHLKANASLTSLERVKATHFKSAYTETRFQSPMLLVHEHDELSSRHFSTGYYTYKHKIVGFCAPEEEAVEVEQISKWMSTATRPLQAFVSAGGTTTFTQKASWVGLHDIKAIPYPESGTLDLSQNETILVNDIVDYYRSLIRLGEDSEAMKESGSGHLPFFTEVFCTQINAIYKKKPLRVLTPQIWPGFICQPFVFGKGEVDWHGVEELKGKLDGLLKERQTTLHVTRIVRLYEGDFIFLLKPDRLRYWLRSIALRDADETLADLRAQGF